MWSNAQRPNDALDSNRSTLAHKLAHGEPRDRFTLGNALRCGLLISGDDRALCALEVDAGDPFAAFGFERRELCRVIDVAGCATPSKKSLHVQRRMVGDSLGKAGLHAELFQLICLLNNPLPFTDETAANCDSRVRPAFAERKVTSQLFSQS